MSNNLVVYETSSGKVELSPQIVKQFLVSGQGSVTDQEVMMFLNLCMYQKLNPFLREAYLIKYGSSPATIVVGKETFTKRAEAHEQYDGMEAGVAVYSTDTGEVTSRQGTLVLPGEVLAGGWARVYRKNWTHPVEASVNLSEYLQYKSNGEVQSNWKKMPGTMIRKVAVMQALREAFPQEFGGLYGPEEMPIDDTKLPTSPVNMQEAPRTVEVTPSQVETAEEIKQAEQYICQGEPCQGKNKVITQKVAEFSKSKYGKELCFTCQKLAAVGELV